MWGPSNTLGSECLLVGGNIWHLLPLRVLLPLTPSSIVLNPKLTPSPLQVPNAGMPPFATHTCALHDLLQPSLHPLS